MEARHTTGKRAGTGREAILIRADGRHWRREDNHRGPGEHGGGTSTDRRRQFYGIWNSS